MTKESSLDKIQTAKAVRVSRSMLYYHHKQPDKDWILKQQIEIALRQFPSYGHKRLANHLKINKKRVLRAMKLFGIKPYRRRGKKPSYTKTKRTFPNLLLTETPSYENHIWATDFTEIVYKKTKLYVSTIIDLFTRKIVGVNVAIRKGAPLSLQTLANALTHANPPAIFHSDNGKEYEAKSFIEALHKIGVQISRSKPGCPWENGYQESFYDKFKIDLGDPNRFKTLGELVWEIHRTIYDYNHTRIHSILKMPPAVFAERQKELAIASQKVETAD